MYYQSKVWKHMLFMFLKEVSCPYQACIYLIKKTREKLYCKKNILLQFKITVFNFNLT